MESEVERGEGWKVPIQPRRDLVPVAEMVFHVTKRGWEEDADGLDVLDRLRAAVEKALWKEEAVEREVLEELAVGVEVDVEVDAEDERGRGTARWTELVVVGSFVVVVVGVGGLALDSSGRVMVWESLSVENSSQRTIVCCRDKGVASCRREEWRTSKQ